MGLVKNSLTFSLYVQILTTFLGFFGLIYKLRPQDMILKEILSLETIVQVIEFGFYFWFSYMYTKNIDKTDITRWRYYDWFFTTPIMLLTTIVYFEYNNIENRKKNGLNNGSNDTPFTTKEFIKNNHRNISHIITYNFMMLLIGYLQEIGLINIWMSTIIGFYFLYLTFNIIYQEYASKSRENLQLYWIMTITWSLYGVAAMFDSKYKNFAYNILDIVSKNFYGLYITYLIYEKRIQ